MNAELEKIASSLKKIYKREIKILNVKFSEFNKGEMEITVHIASLSSNT
jgi:hypothetical protein